MTASKRSGGPLRRAVRSVVSDSVRAQITSVYRPLVHRGDAVTCSVCDSDFGSFVDHRGLPSVRCPRCGSMERHRLLALYLRAETDLFTRHQRLLHLAPEWGFRRMFVAAEGIDYVTADLESPLADVHCDIAAMPFADGSFDALLCNHVLEHVPDDRAALRELRRVLKPGGWAILMSPIGRDRETTFEDPLVTEPEDRLRIYGQEDHVRLYGADYVARLEEAGFDVEIVDQLARLDEPTIERLRVRRQDAFFDDDLIFRASRRPD